MSNNNPTNEEEEELPHFSVKSSNRKSDKSGGSRKKQQHRGKEPIQDSGIDSSFFISANTNSGVMSNNFLPPISPSQRDRSFQNQPDSEPANDRSGSFVPNTQENQSSSRNGRQKPNAQWNQEQAQPNQSYQDNELLIATGGSKKGTHANSSLRETAHAGISSPVSDQRHRISIDTDDAGKVVGLQGIRSPKVAIQKVDEVEPSAAKKRRALQENGKMNSYGGNLGGSASNDRNLLDINSGRGSFSKPQMSNRSLGSNNSSAQVSARISARRHTVAPKQGTSLLNAGAMRRVQILAGVDKANTPYNSKGLSKDLGPAGQDQNSVNATGGPAIIYQEGSAGGASFDKKSSIQNAKADGSMQAGSMQGQISHSGTVISRTATDKMLNLDFDDTIDVIPDEQIKIKPKAAWKVKGEKLLENYYWIGMMSIVTFYALFADDLRILLLPQEADMTLDVLTIIAILLYSIELVLGMICIDKYFMSFYFWVDFVSLLSMIPDVSFFLDAFDQGIGGAGDGADIAKTGRASKVVKIVRIIRLIRLLRVVKLYKQVKTGQKIKNQKIQQQRENKRLARKKGNSLGTLQTIDAGNPGKRRNSDAVGIINDSLDSFDDELARVDKDYSEKILDDDLTLQNFRSEHGGADNLSQRINSAERNEDNDQNKSGGSSFSGFGSPRKPAAKPKSEDEENDEENVNLESNISKALSDKITKVVLILVLCMLFLLPILDLDTYIEQQIVYTNAITLLVKQYDLNKSWFAYQQTVKMTEQSVTTWNSDLDVENYHPAIVMQIADPNGDPWNQDLKEIYPNRGEMDVNVDNYRKLEKNTILGTTDSGVQFSITYSLKSEAQLEAGINLARTCWVIFVLTIAAIYFGHVTNKLVLHPLERMLEIVKKIAKDPSSAAAQEEMQNAGVFTFLNQQDGGKKKLDQNMETAILEQAIQKIGHLLTLGFGEAGSTIIAQNISSGGDMNPMMPGQKIYGIFGFCIVHDFATCTEVLQEDVITFVNQIAEITHTAVTKYGGQANKNLGDAYLLVWKFPNPDELKTKTPLEEIKFSPENRNIADMSIFAFLKVLARVHKYQHIRRYRKHVGLTEAIENYKVQMGFGLHQGWAIEGAIGSYFKIDASYLSPNVNMSSRLEMATMQYGVHILVSGKLVPILSKEVKKLMREVDIVKVKGSEEPMKIFTVDVQVEDIAEVTDRFKKLMIKDKKRMLDREKFVLWESLKRRAMTTMSVYRNDNDFSDLRKKYNKQFGVHWKLAYDAYVAGDWSTAHRLLRDGQEMSPDDGPTKTLLRVIENMSERPGYNAPKDWQGWRALTEK